MILRNPESIENKSFQIIDNEIGEHNFSPVEYQVLRRIIHSSADFDFKDNLVFSNDAVSYAVNSLKKGVPIVCDVKMVYAGINKKLLEKLGCKSYCFVSDDDVIKEAKKTGLTRSIIAMRKACSLYPKSIFLIGNAPTALLELINLINEGKSSPSLVVGVPVGFVSAPLSKELLLSQKDIPFIVALGRKGGSTIAVSCINALLILASSQENARKQ